MADLLSHDYSTTSAVTARSEYEFTLKLRMDCPNQLWTAAAARCMEQTGMSIDEIEEMIGPIDDPSLEDCLTLLILPQIVPGCTKLYVETQANLL